MTINWSQVTVHHICQACELYDAGVASPKRPARSTFLYFNKKVYPAKFIRGLAYRIATGIELDSNFHYSGGNETARFFAGLGLPTSNSPAVTVASSLSSPALIPIAPTKNLLVERKYEPQKMALFNLLKKRFHKVECEARFPWLVVPDVNEMEEPLATIFQALQAMRGFSNFITPGWPLQCDFCIPDERLIIEYDERQHFTDQRAKTLDLYPASLVLAFDRKSWMTACQSIKASDPNPPHRDEQRAFYDSMRDVLAAENGFRLVRLQQGEVDWTNPNSVENLIAAIPVQDNNATPMKGTPESKCCNKIALVSHNYNISDSQKLYDYSEHFAQINKLCDDHGCDTILYALYTWDSTSAIPRTHGSFFGGLNHVQRIILEVGQPPKSHEHVEIWLRRQPEPLLAYQRFAATTDSVSAKYQFMHDLPERQFDSILLVICGETNITRSKRKSNTFDDSYGFMQQVRGMNPKLILNPIHDYMTRPEMKKKRRLYSREGRTVISVWNRGRGKEAWIPWTVYHDGEEWTARVQELQTPITDRRDIRIGILDLPVENEV